MFAGDVSFEVGARGPQIRRALGNEGRWLRQRPFFMPNDMDPPAAGPNCRSRILPLENWSPPPGDLCFFDHPPEFLRAVIAAVIQPVTRAALPSRS